MLRLNVSDVDLDLYQDEAVNLTVQFSDLEGINSPVGSFSQTFRVPGTQKNMDLFGPINMVDPGSVNLKTKKAAELFSGSVSILRGFVQVKAVYLQKKEYADIELVFFAGAVDLKTAIGDGMLTDLDLSADDHDLTYANVTGSWTGSGVGPEITYGLIDKGDNWDFDTGQIPWTLSNGLYLGQLTPMFQAKYVFDKIMTGAGYTYDSTFLEGTGSESFEKIYLPGLNGSSAPITTDNDQPNARAGLDADFTGSTLTTLDLVDNATGAIDDGSNWNNTTHKYTAPYTGKFALRLTYSYDQGSHTNHVTIQVVKNASTVLFSADSGPSTAQNRLKAFLFDLEENDTIEVKGRAHAAGVSIKGNDSTISGIRTSLEIIGGFPFSGFEVDVAANMPELKQIDFVTGLQKMFNLVFVPDKNREKHLLIEPYVDYMAAGTDKAWNDLIDYGHDITLKPTTDLQAKQYEWTHKAGRDFLSQSVDNSLDRVYGNYRVTDADNDFAAGEKKVETPFAPYITSLIPGSDFPIHRSLKQDGTGIDNPLPMLAYYHGLVNEFGTWYLRNDNGIETALTTFPSFSNYSNDLPELTSLDLNYGMEAPFITVECNPRDTLFIKYWSQYVTELYSEEARLMTLHLKLDRVELAGFEFSDKIWMRGARWRVLNMTYDANVEGLVQVECIKVLSDVAFCADEPTFLRVSQNEILFNGSSALDPDYGSQACCEAYGYQWVVDKVSGNRCRPRLVTQQPTT
jgi:hypothetical protein